MRDAERVEAAHIQVGTRTSMCAHRENYTDLHPILTENSKIHVTKLSPAKRCEYINNEPCIRCRQ